MYVFALGTVYEPIENKLDISKAKSLMETYFNNLDEYFGNKDQRKKARNILELMWFRNEKEN